MEKKSTSRKVVEAAATSLAAAATIFGCASNDIYNNPSFQRYVADEQPQKKISYFLDEEVFGKYDFHKVKDSDGDITYLVSARGDPKLQFSEEVLSKSEKIKSVEDLEEMTKHQRLTVGQVHTHYNDEANIDYVILWTYEPLSPNLLGSSDVQVLKYDRLDGVVKVGFGNNFKILEEGGGGAAGAGLALRRVR